MSRQRRGVVDLKIVAMESGGSGDDGCKGVPPKTSKIRLAAVRGDESENESG